ncbi:MAG: pyridoxamine 5'-phosphate oxidase [Anaerolineae bacterium]|nr:pyridoxamine 5'-phosphate oxidase [Anaerolineae bacterium]
MDSLNEKHQQLKNTRLSRQNLPDEPFVQFEHWLQEAHEAQLPHPNAMSLATVSAEGRVSSRMVMLRLFDERGFVFFTGLETQKAQEIGQNENVSLLFPWLMLERQVRVAGTAVSLPKAETLQFFLSRSRGSQMGAWLAQTSDVISSRSVMESKLAELKQKFADGQVPIPSAWGGFRVIPRRIEFWQGHADHLHDRFEYLLDKQGNWVIERLLP